MKTILVDPDDGGFGAYCIGGPPGRATLCGWKDVRFTEHDHPVTCRNCLLDRDNREVQKEAARKAHRKTDIRIPLEWLQQIANSEDTEWTFESYGGNVLLAVKKQVTNKGGAKTEVVDFVYNPDD